LILGIEKDPLDAHFNKICAKGYEEYIGPQPCVYGIVRAMADGMMKMKSVLGNSSKFWNWGNAHKNFYGALPWSNT